MHHLRTISISTVLLLSIACSPSEDTGPTTEAPAPTLEGLLLKGTALDSKRLGFANCEVTYYSAVCSKSEVDFFGFTKKATISFRLENGHMPSDHTQLKYDTIQLNFPDLIRTYPCAGSKMPMGCFEDNETSQLARKLIAEGWTHSDWKGHWRFYHPKQRAEIVLRESSALADNYGVGVTYASLSSVGESINFIKRKSETADAQHKAAEDFKQSMKIK
jgi:hypothetical protein